MEQRHKIAVWGALFATAIVAVLLIANTTGFWKASMQFEERIAALRDAGHPATLSDLTPAPVPPQQNAAVHLRRAQEDLDAIVSGLDDVTASGLLEGHHSESELQTIQSTLEAFPDLFPLLQQAADCPGYDSQPDCSVGVEAFIDDHLLPHARRARRVIRVLSARTVLLVSQGKRDEALRTGILLLRLSRHFQREPFPAGYLVALACSDAGARMADLALRGGKASEDARRALDAELACHEGTQSYVWALRSGHAGKIDERRQTIRWLNYRLSMQALRAADAFDRVNAPDARAALASQPYWKAVAKMPQLAKSVPRQAMERNRAQMRCLRVLNAVQGYVERTADYGPRLSDLGLPEQATTDPFSGKPLKMRKVPDGWLVYSVGKDLIDDGGQSEEGRDVGFGPRPATQLEITEDDADPTPP